MGLDRLARAAAAALLLAGLNSLLLACAGVSVETVEVQVPVAARAAPPAELAAPLADCLMAGRTSEASRATCLPVFVAPADPAATSALTAAGERDLQQLLLELLTRLRAWAVWAQPSRHGE